MYRITILMLLAFGVCIGNEDKRTHECYDDKSRVKCPPGMICEEVRAGTGVASMEENFFCHKDSSTLPNNYCLNERVLEQFVAGLMESSEECDPFDNNCPKGLACCKTDKGHRCFHMLKDTRTIRDDEDIHNKP